MINEINEGHVIKESIHDLILRIYLIYKKARNFGIKLIYYTNKIIIIKIYNYFIFKIFYYSTQEKKKNSSKILTHKG